MRAAETGATVWAQAGAWAAHDLVNIIGAGLLHLRLVRSTSILGDSIRKAHTALTAVFKSASAARAPLKYPRSPPLVAVDAINAVDPGFAPAKCD